MMDRRQFLKSGILVGALVGGLGLPIDFMSQAHAANPGFDLTTGSRVLKLYRPESKEHLHIEYLRDGKWVGNAYSQICWFLRDIHVNKSVAMDLQLIAALDWIQQYLRQYGYAETIHILSAYRSPQTNAGTEGAAQTSQHLLGKAVDFRIPGLPADYLGRLLKWLAKGGVGVYEHNRDVDRQFVHLDTGGDRSWRR